MGYCNSGLTTDLREYKLIQNVGVIRIYDLESRVYVRYECQKLLFVPP
jgi:hypothetical protein